MEEISNVLAQYLELQADGLRQHLMPHSVVDWFGRTIRGGPKIINYLRFEIATQYEHANFEKAEECGPIECWPTHMRTQKAPVHDVECVTNPRNRVSGITSLKLHADSDEDDLDDEVMLPLALGNKTPERHEGEPVIVPLTPPSSRTKQESDASATDSDDDADEFMELRAKRMKRTYPTSSSSSSNSYLRRLPATREFKRKSATDGKVAMRTLLDDSTSDEEEAPDHRRITDGTPSKFTALRYLEVTGVLRRRTNTEDGDPLAAQMSDADALSGGGGLPTSGWERPIRMRISYRTRIADQQLLFALIIYEHLDGRPKLSRRNLLTEFSQAASNEILNDNEAAAVDDDPIAGEPLPTAETMLAAVETLSDDGLTINETTSLDATIASLRTPTKLMHTPPPTPKRKPRSHQAISGLRRVTWTPPSARPKRSAARSLRL